MKKLSALLASEFGAIHTLPLLLIVAAVGIVSYLLISSTAPFNGGLFGNLNPRPGSEAATSGCGLTNPVFCDTLTNQCLKVTDQGI